MPRSVLFVLAMPGSGAPALAAMFARAGVETIAPTSGDDLAEGARTALGERSQRMLAHLGMQWDTLARPPERWADANGWRQLVPEITAVLRCNDSSAPLVVVEPAASRAFPVWRMACEAAGSRLSTALWLRRPGEVAAALAKKASFAPEKSLALWLGHLVELEAATRGVPRAVLTHHALHTTAAAAIERLLVDSSFDCGVPPAKLAAFVEATPRATPEAPRAGAMVSGLDTAVDEAYLKLAAASPRSDLRKAVAAIETSARAALNAAIPPWLGREFETLRVQAERGTRSLEQVEKRAAIAEVGHGDARELAAQIEGLREEQAHERATLRSQLAATQGELARLTGALAEAPRAEALLRAEAAQAQRDLADERANIVRLTDAIEELRREADGNAQRFESTRHHLELLASELEQGRVSVEMHENMYARVAAEADNLRVQVSDLADERDALRRERDTMRKERDSALRQFDRAMHDLEAARTTLASVTEEREALAAALNDTAHELDSVREALTAHAASTEVAQAERLHLESTLLETSTRLDNLERELRQRALDGAELKARHEKLAKRGLVRAAVWLAGDT